MPEGKIMSNFEPLNKAKKAAELATQTAKGMKERATSRAAEMRDRTVSKAQEASDMALAMRDQASSKVGGLKDLLAGKIADVKDAALSGIGEMVADLNAHLPALREAGYTLSEVSVQLGLPPKLVATFAAQSDITEERIEAVIEEHKEAKVTSALLRALYGANKLQNAIQIAGMKPRGIALEIGITPGVEVKFA